MPCYDAAIDYANTSRPVVRWTCGNWERIWCRRSRFRSTEGRRWREVNFRDNPSTENAREGGTGQYCLGQTECFANIHIGDAVQTIVRRGLIGGDQLPELSEKCIGGLSVARVPQFHFHHVTPRRVADPVRQIHRSGMLAVVRCDPLETAFPRFHWSGSMNSSTSHLVDFFPGLGPAAYVAIAS